jgi:hypothetical protein
MVYDRAMTAFVRCFLLEGVAIGEDGLLVLSWWCLYCCYKIQIVVAGLLFYVILLLFWLCASVMLLGLVLLQRQGVIGIFAVLIYTPYKKKLSAAVGAWHMGTSPAPLTWGLS